MNPEAHAVTEPAEAEADANSGIGGEIVAGMIGSVIAIVCLLPPIVHLVLGPLGPGIGGFVAGNRVRSGARGTVVIALMVGSAFGGLLAIGATLLHKFAKQSELPSWFPEQGVLWGIIAGAFCYATVLAAIGAAIASSAKREGKTE
jgi:hypothetical protein